MDRVSREDARVASILRAVSALWRADEFLDRRGWGGIGLGRDLYDCPPSSVNCLTHERNRTNASSPPATHVAHGDSLRG